MTPSSNERPLPTPDQGEILGDRFELRARLGRGGAGDVWRALDRWTGVERALKVLRDAPPDGVPDEVLLLADIRHPGLARLHDYVPGPRPAFSMDLIEGHDLEPGRDLPFTTLVRVANDVLEALSFLHGRGILHRDVKPANIRVTREGHGVLLDLGLAAMIGSGNLAGTPTWLAPEVLRGAPQSARSDLFATGAALRGAADDDARRTLGTWLDHLTATEPEARPISALDALRGLRDIAPDLPRTTALPSPRLIGREAELELSTDALRQLQNGEPDGPRLIVLEGPRGSGRGRLQTTLRHRAQMLGLRALDLGEDPGFEEPTQREEALSPSALGAARARANERRLAPLRDASGPTVVLVDTDDTDDSGIELVRRLDAERRPELMIIARARPDDPRLATLATGRSSLRIPLKSLDLDARTDLVRDVTGAPADAQGAREIASRIGDATSDLPGPFLDSLRALAATGGVVARGDHVALTTRDVPTNSTTAAIARSLSDLEEPEQHALRCLVGFGAPLGPMARAALRCGDNALEALTRMGLAERRRAGDRRIYHPTLQDHEGALELSDEARCRLADAAVEAADEVGPGAVQLALTHRLRCSTTNDSDAEAALELAASLLQAGRIETAQRLLRTVTHAKSASGKLGSDAAGRLARVDACLGRAEAARGAAATAIALAPTAIDRARALSCAGEAERLIGDARAATRAFDEALDEDLLSSDERARALRIRAICHLQLGRTNDASVDADAAIESAQGRRERVTCLGTRAQVLHRAGAPKDALAALDLAVTEIDPIQDGTLAAGLLQLRGLIRASQGEPAQAIEDLETAATAFDEAGHVVNLASTLNNLALLHERTGALARALETHERAEAIREQVGDPTALATSRVNRGALLARTGRWSEGRECLIAARAAFRENGHARSEAAAATALAKLEHDTGHSEAAIEVASRALEIAENGAFLSEGAAAAIVLAEAHSSTPEKDKESIALLARHVPSELASTRSYATSARLHARMGETAAAERDARAAREAADSPSDIVSATAALVATDIATSSDAARLADTLPELACPADRVDAELLIARIAPERAARHRLAESLEHALLDLAPEEGNIMFTKRWSQEVEVVLEQLRDDDEGLSGESMRALQRISRTLTSGRRPDDVLEELLDACVELARAEHGFIVLRDGDDFRCVAARTAAGEAVEIPDRLLSSTIVHDVLANGRPIMTGNARDDARFGTMLSVNNLKLTSVACIPFTAEGRVRGAIYLDHPGREDLFSESRIRLLSSFADHAAMVFQRSEHEERITSLNDQLKDLLQHEKKRGRTAAAQARDAGGDENGIVAESKGMRDVLALVDRVAPTDIPVLIVGETGTGKDVVARALHERSTRADGNYLSENCAAIPAPLLEAELFGAVKGAYTGATANRSGLMTLASGGTLFLDEVGDLPEELQSKLLRALEDGSIRPLGSGKRVATDFRLVTATNRDAEELRAGIRFRSDLFYRIGATVIEIPPLRERPEDTAAFIDRYLASRTDKTLKLEPATRRRLLAYDWPGNFRELQNEMARLAALADSTIDEALLSERIRQHQAPASSEIPYDLQELRGWALNRALDTASGNKQEAAELLGVSRSTLYQELKKHGLSRHLRAYNRASSST